MARDSFFQTSADLPRVVEIDLDRLTANPEQPRTRFDAAAIDDLAASIERHGLLQPVIVRTSGEGSYVLIAGERRMRACRKLGRKTIAAILTDGDAGEIALIENLQRENLDPFDEAAAVARLMAERGYSQNEIGKIIGKRQNTVSALLSLTTLPERIRREYPTSDRVSKSWLIELAQVQGEREQLRLWDRAKSAPVTVREIRGARGTTDAASTGDDVVVTARMARRLLDRLSRLPAQGLDADDRIRADLLRLHRELGSKLGLKTPDDT
ncbi:MAG: ParB/RepB/Spo0J family partition protein [Geminicoccaceae bacterium]|nr:ParB/RepB/Spo0J family partition protein [Geminicoccaceae bacterium]